MYVPLTRNLEITHEKPRDYTRETSMNVGFFDLCYVTLGNKMKNPFCSFFVVFSPIKLMSLLSERTEITTHEMPRRTKGDVPPLLCKNLSRITPKRRHFQNKATASRHDLVTFTFSGELLSKQKKKVQYISAKKLCLFSKIKTVE